MLEIVLDTNIYRRNPLRDKAGFKAIVRLAKSGKLRLHIPYFVYEEFVSQQIENYEKNVTSISRAISDLNRKPIPDDLKERLEDLKKNFVDMQGEFLKYPEEEFRSWVEDINGKTHSIAANHAERVVRAYFDGAPPFKNKKNRDDIPDAFIWQTILDLANKHKRLYVIAGDNEIRNSCEVISNITAFNSLDEFITSDICRPILRDENAKENTERLLVYLPTIIALREEMIENQLVCIRQRKCEPNSSLTSLRGSFTAEAVSDLEGGIAALRCAVFAMTCVHGTLDYYSISNIVFALAR